MATVNDTVRHAITRYPSLFTSRIEVLHYLFCVIGNGHEWEKGEIVNGNDDPTPVWTEETERARRTEFFTNLGMTAEDFAEIGQTTEMEDADIARLAEIVATVDTRMFDMDNYSRSYIYPQSDYALLMDIPEDVKPDWAEAAEEIKAWATAKGWEF